MLNHAVDFKDAKMWLLFKPASSSMLAQWQREIETGTC